MRLTLLGLAAHRVGDAARAEDTRDEAITLSARHRRAWEQALGLSGLASVVRSRREVLNLLANRLSDREIGSLLYIGTRTAEFHVANVIGKLGVTNRRETAAVASQRGLV